MGGTCRFLKCFNKVIKEGYMFTFSMAAPKLKQGVTLKGVSIIGALTRIRTWTGGPPEPPAMMEGVPVDNMTRQQLLDAIYDLTGERALNLLALTTKGDNVDNLRTMLHILILQANMEGVETNVARHRHDDGQPPRQKQRVGHLR